ncbi:MAG: hypothetical protein ABI823_13840 [Bryobacteraceae bacterium]
MLGSDRPNVRIATTLLLVFVAGAISGGLAVRYGLPTARAVRSGPSLKMGNKEIFLQRFKTELDLTSDQVRDVSAALEDFNMYYQSLQDQLEDVRATGKNRIVQILRPDQRVKFERMLSDLQGK